MLIIKPYGRSEAAFGDERELRRHLRRRPDDSGPWEVPEFAERHPELVVAQWISAIDRIAAKPRLGGKPTPEQRRLRTVLGEAAWEILRQRLPADGADDLARLWRRKLHPYGDGDDVKPSGPEKGRWYPRFAGDIAAGKIGKAEATAIAGRIEEHLYRGEYRIDGARPNRRQGRIAARAASIAGNVIAPVRELAGETWTEADAGRYRAEGNVALKIRQAAEALEANGRRVRPAVAAKCLHEHYPRLFPGADGEALSIAEARQSEPGLFALHMAVRETYTRILKNHGKRQVAPLLPGDMDALFRLVGAMGRNRDLNALIRLGKLLHYEAGDEPAQAVAALPDDRSIEGGRYRTSAGQAEIKRNEAFVRIWRGAVALAQRTLTGWANSERDVDKDVLGRIEKVTGEGFDEAACDAGLRLLFGSRAGLFDTADKREVLRFALRGWEGLRNNAFHFKGRGGFARALSESVASAGSALPEVAELLAADERDRQARLVAALRGAGVEDVWPADRLEALLLAVAGGARAQSPLPRFRRVLDRAENAWRREPFRLGLPKPENRRTMQEHPGLRARYVALKMLYERAFPGWLQERDADALNAWIARAAERATKAAQAINRDPDAAARSAGLVRLQPGETIAEFSDRLTALTASEYRVQRGYASDPDAARKQAKHIEDLRCDVIAQAFDAYIADAGFGWMLADPSQEPPAAAGQGALDRIALPEQPGAGAGREGWSAALYFLIHLVPVEAVSGLRHQLRKWSVLELAASGHTAVAEVERLFDLYLDMHDAKFEGGEGVVGAEALRSLFENPADFARVCPESPGGEADRHVPWRGLREMLRFGAREPQLMPLFNEHPVRSAEIAELERLEAGPADGGLSPVARAHGRREELHAQWVKEKRLSREDREDYRQALGEVVRHRHLAGHVRLVNHARLHRLAMAVLARLADYAGLWERDLYFAALALTRLEGMKPEEVFRGKGLRLLREGQIVGALRELRKSDDGSEGVVGKELRRLFGKDFLDSGGGGGVRPDLMHFNMLQRSENRPFDLTEVANRARGLMAYDRKLKNAVSRSIIELLAREGFDLRWEMRDHALAGATVTSRQAVHLGKSNIAEDLHGSSMTGMVARLFGGSAPPGREDRGRRTEAPKPARPAAALQAGQRVSGVLIDEKTKKGGWKAAVEHGGERIVGNIHNSDAVPPEAEPGREEELVVRVANPRNASWEWPTPEVEARLAKPPRRPQRPKPRRR